MKRMSEFYFDVNQWEEDLAREQESEGSSGKKRKRPTKKDLVSRPRGPQRDAQLFCFRRGLRSRNVSRRLPKLLGCVLEDFTPVHYLKFSKMLVTGLRVTSFVVLPLPNAVDNELPKAIRHLYIRHFF